MNITNQEAEYLLKLPKKIFDGNRILNDIRISQEFPFNKRFTLISEQDSEFTFLWEFQQSRKNTIRVSFHCQDNDSKIGLLRVDYNSGHKNPEKVTEFVPKKFHPFAGKCFTEHHIHYYVQGYKNLAWAIPLTDDDFDIKQLGEGDEFNHTLSQIIDTFAKTLNITTKIIVDELLL